VKIEEMDYSQVEARILASYLQRSAEILRELEWSGTRWGQGSHMGAGDGRRFRACPICGGIDPSEPWQREFIRGTEGHRKDCRLQNLRMETML
jgi:hypothetical protein